MNRDRGVSRADSMTQLQHSCPYLIVSGLCFAVHNVTLIGGDTFGLPLWLIISLSFAIVQPLGYLGHSLATFARPLSWRAFFHYSAAMAANIPIAFGLVWLVRDFVGLPMMIVAPLSSVLILVINYCLSRWAILRSDHRKVSP